MTTMQDPQQSTNRMLAAVAAVIHRRTGQDQVRIDVHATGSISGVITVGLDDDPPFRVLSDRVERALAELPEACAVAGGTSAAACLGAGQSGDRPDVVLELAVDASLTGVRLSTEPAAAGEQPSGDASAVMAATDAALAAGELSPDTRVSWLPMTTETDRFTRWCDPVGGEAAATNARTVHELVIAQARRTPDAFALRGTERLTYRELEQRSGELAADLRALPSGPGAVVGVLMHRSPQLITTLLAVLRAGAAYLALDPDDHPDRLSRLLADSGAVMVVTEPSLRARVPGEVRVHVPGAVRPGAQASAQPEARPLTGQDAPTPEAGRLAYVSYTSGSTGEPKGVAVPHRAVVRLVEAPDWITVQADDVFLQLAPVAFDASTLEIWAPLAHGAELVLFRPGPIDTGELAQTIRDQRISVLWLTAGLFHQMAAGHLDAFAGVRHVVAGGDVLSPEHVRTLMAAHPGLVFTNGYGPTENTTFTTCWTSTVAPAPGAAVPIGRPIGGTGVAVLDAALRPVPVGVRGELYAMGDGLAHGYLNRPGETAERFVPCPEPGYSGRMYRTGDVVRWLPSGDLEFLGRADQQVKIRGYRVEPGAVEAELLRDPRVQQAVVLAQSDDAGDKRLLAYVTLVERTEQPGDISVRLREVLAATLPDYLVPWAVLVRRDLPLNRNGKVDRAALPIARRVPRNAWNDFVAAKTPLESAIAEVWGELLGIEPIGVEDDFFDLGGHSLLAVDLIDTLRNRLGVNMEARMLYLQPTVAELAQNLVDLSPSLATVEVL